MEFDHCTRNGACEFYKRFPFFVREIKRNHSFLKRNREGGGGGTRISRVSRGKKNRIGISISFQSEIKGRLNADTLRSIEGRVDIAAWKITEGARGRRVRRGSRGKRTWKTNGRRGKGEGEDERDGRREKRRLAADSTVTERDKERGTNSILSSSSFRFHPPPPPQASSSFPPVFVQRDAQSIAICRLRDIVGADIR